MGEKSDGTFQMYFNEESNSDLFRILHPVTKYPDAPENGEYTEYYSNGDIGEKGYFKDGKFHGTWTVWYRNGQKCWEGFYHEGIQVGKWVEWDIDGQTTIELYYRDGEIDLEKSLETQKLTSESRNEV